MRRLLQTVDQLLRGQLTRAEDLREGRIAIAAGPLIGAGIVLGAAYGAFMGLYAALRQRNPTVLQMPAVALKVPLLFLLTLAVTLPSLYVFSALAQSRLRFPETVRLLLAAVVVNLALLASLGPVTAFFTLSTESYAFMVFLNVCCFALSGAIGVGFLARALGHVFAPAPAPPHQPHAAAPAVESGPPPLPLAMVAPPPHLRHLPREDRSSLVLRTWILIYALVGAQMGWILRPFIGNPVDGWSLFRARQSNVFQALQQMLRELLG